jgi:hypothetical protein
MRKTTCLVTLLALAWLTTETNRARADRVPTVRASGFYTTWPKSDITVPYLTTGRSTFMSRTVEPQILIMPNVDNVRYPQIVPVFNLPFYGARQGFGDKLNGAEPRSLR